MLCTSMGIRGMKGYCHAAMKMKRNWDTLGTANMVYTNIKIHNNLSKFGRNVS